MTLIGGPPSGGVKTTRPTVSFSSVAPSRALSPDTPTSTSIPWCSRPLYSCTRRGTASREHQGMLVERSEEHTSELQSHVNFVCRLPLEKKNLPRVSRDGDEDHRT